MGVPRLDWKLSGELEGDMCGADPKGMELDATGGKQRDPVLLSVGHSNSSCRGEAHAQRPVERSPAIAPPRSFNCAICRPVGCSFAFSLFAWNHRHRYRPQSSHAPCASAKKRARQLSRLLGPRGGAGALSAERGRYGLPASVAT